MSATRDKSQKITFVYSNLYSIYRKGVERAKDSVVPSPEGSKDSEIQNVAETLSRPAIAQRAAHSFESGIVIKAKDLKPESSRPAHAPRVTPYTPAELLGKRVSRPVAIATQAVASAAQAASTSSSAAPSQAPVDKASAQSIENLKRNLASLNDMQARLRFMLKELEDLMKE